MDNEKQIKEDLIYRVVRFEERYNTTTVTRLDMYQYERDLERLNKVLWNECIHGLLRYNIYSEKFEKRV